MQPGKFIYFEHSLPLRSVSRVSVLLWRSPFIHNLSIKERECTITTSDTYKNSIFVTIQPIPFRTWIFQFSFLLLLNLLLPLVVSIFILSIIHPLVCVCRFACLSLPVYMYLFIYLCLCECTLRLFTLTRSFSVLPLLQRLALQADWNKHTHTRLPASKHTVDRLNLSFCTLDT